MSQPPIQLQYAPASLGVSWSRSRRVLMVAMTLPSALAMIAPLGNGVSAFGVLRDYYLYQDNPWLLPVVLPFITAWLLLAMQVRMVVDSRVKLWEWLVLLIAAAASAVASGTLLSNLYVTRDESERIERVIIFGSCALILVGGLRSAILVARRRWTRAAVVALVSAYSVNAYMVGVALFDFRDYGWWVMVVGAFLLIGELVIYRLRPMTNESAGGITHQR